jgi:hypothetical protein
MVILDYTEYIFNYMTFRIDIARQKEDLQQTANWNTSVLEISNARGNIEQCKDTIAIKANSHIPCRSPAMPFR